MESGSGITLHQTTVHDYYNHSKMKAEIIYFSSFSFSHLKNLIKQVLSTSTVAWCALFVGDGYI